jgi:hypothetical protein
LIAALLPRPGKAGFPPAFLYGDAEVNGGAQASRTGAAGVHRRSFEKKSRFEKISRCTQLFVTFGYYGVARLVGHRTCVLLR